MMKPKRNLVDFFAGVDLTRPVAELADEMGCSTYAVYRARRILDVKSDPLKTAAFKNLKVDQVDWALPVCKIAQRLGVSRHYLKRRMLDMGKPIPKRGMPPGNGRLASVVFDWSKTNTQLASTHDCSQEFIRQLRKKAGEPNSSSKAWEKKYHT